MERYPGLPKYWLYGSDKGDQRCLRGDLLDLGRHGRQSLRIESRTLGRSDLWVRPNGSEPIGGGKDF